MKASFTVILHILITLLYTNYSMALFNLYDQMKTDVINLNERNFASQIKKPRTTGGVSIIHYYTGDDGQSEDLKSRVEDFAK